MGGEQAGRRLNTNVHVNDRWYGPQDDIPEDVAAKITNPKVWAVDEETAAKAIAEERGRKPGTKSGHTLVARVAVDGTYYGPDDHVPDDVARQIRNKKVWKDGELPSLPPTAKDGARAEATPAPTRTETPETEAPATTTDDGAEESAKRAPDSNAARKTTGSSRRS